MPVELLKFVGVKSVTVPGDFVSIDSSSMIILNFLQ